jgi:hypothetical protein
VLAVAVFLAGDQQLVAAQSCARLGDLISRDYFAVIPATVGGQYVTDNSRFITSIDLELNTSAPLPPLKISTFSLHHDMVSFLF